MVFCSLHFIDSILMRNVQNTFYQWAVVVVIVQLLDVLPVEAVPITTKVVSPNAADDEV